ncbi:sugar ABC transporter permease [Arthrobacter sp. AB6]|uniref:carbohydrate ABC transporter permease n=1 Tax=Arthrobacter sp. AB6 TaxID=2962570 RepID=UPI002882387A|nr:sugar ABC transporter permease [Arthrobacter sp. AB6]MDT0196736.1 sugar ABC transporter permease [Arthrobacter sp. AB6]
MTTLVRDQSVQPLPVTKRSRSKGPQGSLLAVLLLVPALAATLAVSLFPLIQSLYLSFRDTSLAGFSDAFVGGQNFVRLITDGQFQGAWLQTIWFMSTSTVLETILGVGFAIFLHEKFKGRAVLRAMVLIPWAIPTVVTSKIFQRMFDGQVGIVNFFLEKFGFTSSYINFLGEPAIAMWTLIAADVWKTTPFMAVLTLAALQTIPDSLVESARMDGAGPIRTFLYVRLPLLMPAILVAALVRCLDAFRIFDLPYVLTGGGPAGSTETVSTLAYKSMFSALEVGYGSAINIAILVSEALIALVFVVFMARQFRKVEG